MRTSITICDINLIMLQIQKSKIRHIMKMFHALYVIVRYIQNVYIIKSIDAFDLLYSIVIQYKFL